MTLNVTPADAVIITKPAKDLLPGDLFVWTDTSDRDLSFTVSSVQDTPDLAFGSETNHMLHLYFSDAPRVIARIEVPEEQDVRVALPPLPVLTERINAAQARAMQLRSASARVTSALAILNEIPSTPADLVLTQSRSELSAAAVRLDGQARSADRSADRDGEAARMVWEEETRRAKT